MPNLKIENLLRSYHHPLFLNHYLCCQGSRLWRRCASGENNEQWRGWDESMVNEDEK